MGEQKQKRQRKFNFFDILILVILVLIIAVGAAYLLRDRTENPVETVSVAYTVLVKDQPKAMNIRIEEGETAIDSRKLKVCGTITSVTIEPATYDVYAKNTGSLVHGVMQTTNNVYITIRAEVEENSAGYLLNGEHLSVGSVSYIRMPRFVAIGYVVAVEEITEEN